MPWSRRRRRRRMRRGTSRVSEPQAFSVPTGSIMAAWILPSHARRCVTAGSTRWLSMVDSPSGFWPVRVSMSATTSTVDSVPREACNVPVMSAAAVLARIALRPPSRSMVSVRVSVSVCSLAMVSAVALLTAARAWAISAVGRVTVMVMVPSLLFTNVQLCGVVSLPSSSTWSGLGSLLSMRSSCDAVAARAVPMSSVSFSGVTTRAMARTLEYESSPARNASRR